MKKAFSLVFAIIFCLLPFLSACSQNGPSTDGPKTTAEPPSTNAPSGTTEAAVTEPAETAPQFLPDELPADLKFDGETCTVFCWESWDPSEFFVAEDSGDIVDAAVYARNLAVEERLGIKLVWDQQPRQESAYGSALKDALAQQNAAADNTYDAVACYGMRVASCAIGGQLINLRETQYIDFDKPWYYASATKAGTLHKGYTFFCAGDISYNALARMSGVFFNSDMIRDNNMEDPYEIVLAGKWTIDRMHDMIRDMYADLDGDGKRSDEDRYGIMIAGDQAQTLYYGTGSHFIEHDADDNPIISDDLYSERTITIIDKYVALLGENAAYKNPTGDEPKNFDEGRVLFYVYPLGHVSDPTLRESEINYGFIPQPKVEESDKEYHASVTNAITLFAIPLVVSSHDKSSALIECLSSEGYRRVTPVVFEQAYKVKYNYDSSARQTQIFDILRENAVFDLGKIFSSELFGGISTGVIDTQVWNGKNNFSSIMKRYENNIKRGMDKLTNSLKLG